MPFLPVDYDPFDGDPEATGAAAASQAMQPATQPFVDLAGNLANTLAVQPVLSAYNTTDRVLAGQGFTPDEALNAAGLAMAGSTGVGGLGAGPRIRVYHGSPHDFDAFDLNKVGTGEGAQAYGHGLYFAENPAVAEDYRRNVLNMPVIDAANERMREIAREMDTYRKPGTLREFTDPRGYDLAAEYDQLMAQKMKPGNMYQVGINADPNSFLHWDKPLGEQAEPIQQFFAGIPGVSNESTGAEAYNLLGRGNEPRLSEALNDAGIPGIKYLDQGSRGSYTVIPKNGEWGVLKPDGNEWLHSFPTQDEAAAKAAALNDFERTHNYVVFDPKMIDIIKKYGLAPLVAGGAMTLAGNADAATHAVPVDHDPFAGESPVAH